MAMNLTDLLSKNFKPTIDEDWQLLEAAAQTLFRPRTPVDESRLFAGRFEQVKTLVDVIYEPGGHAIIYGERGVGKTSLRIFQPSTSALSYNDGSCRRSY